MNFFSDFKDITNGNAWEEEKTCKKGLKAKVIVSAKKIYTDSIRTLHKRYNEEAK